ncbi:hypothetical protein [Neoaquamicrobium sediminum]|uniref:hypothetical protein n=1 Tax=Neoaquamicrobium sediminum TaxID=1849104 RepID=UPI003BA962FC
MHREDAEAVIKRARDSGVVTERSHYRRGQLSREDGKPAHLEYDEASGKLTRRLWLVRGEYSRPGGLPPVEWLDKDTGVVVRAEYRVRTDSSGSSQLHRETGPALILYDRITGEQKELGYYRFGRKQGVPLAPVAKL